MPSAPLRYCLTPNCNNKVRSGRCPECERRHIKAYDQQRGTRTERGYDNRWLRYRETFLEEHWYCGARPNGLAPTGDSECLKAGLYVRANTVDHIIPVTGKDDPRFWDEANHQSLCGDSCHQRKRQREGQQGRCTA